MEKKIVFFLHIFIILFTFFPEHEAYLGPSLSNLILLGMNSVLVYYNFVLKKGNTTFHYSTLLVLGAFAVYLAYGILGNIWAKHSGFAGIMVISRFSQLFYVLNFSATITSVKRIKIIHLVYVILGAIFIYIAFWEIFTLKHLKMSSYYGMPPFFIIPTGPFYNTNDFACVLFLLIPYIFFSAKIFKNKLWTALSLVFIVSIIAITSIQGARLAMLGIVPIALIWYLKYFSKKIKIITAATLIVAFYYVAISNSLEMRIFRERVKEQVISFTAESQSVKMKSIQIRKNLLGLSANIFSRNPMGVGPGNYRFNVPFEDYVKTGRVAIPHNYFAEILVDDGLIGLFSILFVYALAFYYSVVLLRKKRNNKYILLANIFYLIMFLPASLFQSSMFQGEFQFVFLAVIIGTNNHYLVKNKQQNLELAKN